MPLFVVLREGAELDDELTTEIARRIREQCSPRHVPDEVFAIAEVPRTLSGKVLEVPVKRILMGTPVEQAAVERLAREPGLARLFRRARAQALRRQCKIEAAGRTQGGLRPADTSPYGLLDEGGTTSGGCNATCARLWLPRSTGLPGGWSPRLRPSRTFPARGTPGTTVRILRTASSLG